MISTFILGGLIIGAGAGIGISQLSFFKNLIGDGKNTQANVAQQGGAETLDTNEISITPVSATDHVRGAQNPKITFVEYSDTECPFCKKFHEVMNQMVAEFPNDVQWVYRNFPLTELHSKAQKEAVALECAAELGGNDSFWKYLDRLMEVTPANNGLDLKELDTIAAYVKLDKSKFSECLNSDRYNAKIEAESQEAVRNGGDGTPFTVVLAPNDKKYLLKGYVDFGPLSEAIKKVLATEEAK